MIISTLAISTLVFSKGNGEGPVGGIGSKMRGNINNKQNQIKNKLSEEQQVQFQKMQSEYKG
jgi:hypothetical protein